MRSFWIKVNPTTFPYKRRHTQEGRKHRHREGHERMEAESGVILPQDP